MRAAWYERKGVARDVLTLGEMDDPRPLAGEVRIRVAASGVNPGDVKKRQDAFSDVMPYPARRPAQRPRWDRGRRGRRGLTGVGRAARLMLWGPDLPPLRHCRRLHRSPSSAGGPAARVGDVLAGHLPRHPRHHRPPGCPCGRPGRGAHRLSARRRGRGRGDDRPTRPSGRGVGHHHLPSSTSPCC